MNDEVIYQIERFDTRSDVESLIERFQVVADGSGFQRRDDQGNEISLGTGDLLGLIEADASLHEIRGRQTTRIGCQSTIIARLPVILTVPHDQSDDYDDEVDSDGRWGVEDDDEPRQICRKLYVNNEAWYCHCTYDKDWMLPSGLTETWGTFFFDTGSMMGGGHESTIGLVTPAVIGWTLGGDYHRSNEGFGRRGVQSDAGEFVDWLMSVMPDMGELNSGPVLDPYRMLTQLFVDAALNGRNGVSASGTWLAAGVAESDESYGISDGTRWCLTLNLDPEMINAVLDELAKDKDFRDIVTAGKDPESPQGRTRQAALREEFPNAFK